MHDREKLPKRGELTPFVFLLSFLILLPLYLKAWQMSVTGIPIGVCWNAFGWEWAFASAAWLGLKASGPAARMAIFACICIFDLLVVFEAVSLSGQIQEGGLVSTIGGALLICGAAHLVPLFCYRFIHLKRLHVLLCVVLYLCAVLIWPPKGLDHVMPLSATVSKFFEEEAVSQIGLPPWEVNHSGLATLPEGYYVVPHIPDFDALFSLELALLNELPQPGSVIFERFKADGRKIGETQMDDIKKVLKLDMRKTFPEAAYVILKANEGISAQATLRGTNMEDLVYPLINRLASKVSMSGAVGSGNRATLVFVNIQDHNDQISLKIKGNGGWEALEVVDLAPGEKRTLHFSMENDQNVLITINGEAVICYVLRQDTLHNLAR